MKKIILLALTFLLFSSPSFAENKEDIGEKIAGIGEDAAGGSAMDNEDLRAWLKRIKPAAGMRQAPKNSYSQKQYWQQTVRRKRGNSFNQ